MGVRIRQLPPIIGKGKVYFSVAVAELVYAPGCESGLCEFESRRSPQSAFVKVIRD